MSRKRLLCSSFTAAPPASVFAHRIKDSLSLPTFKRKQLRHELYPSQPHPPLGTGFLPLSRTDTFFLFFFCPELGHIYSELCSAHLNSHHSSCSFPCTFLFFPLHSSTVRWHCTLILYPVSAAHRHCIIANCKACANRFY